MKICSLANLKKTWIEKLDMKKLKVHLIEIFEASDVDWSRAVDCQLTENLEAVYLYYSNLEPKNKVDI